MRTMHGEEGGLGTIDIIALYPRSLHLQFLQTLSSTETSRSQGREIPICYVEHVITAQFYEVTGDYNLLAMFIPKTIS